MGIDLIKHLCSICYFVFVSFDIDILSNAEHKCGLSDSQPVAILTHLFSSSIKSQTTISMLMLYSLLPEITQYRFWRWFNILYGHSGTFDWSWQAGNLRTEWRVSPTAWNEGYPKVRKNFTNSTFTFKTLEYNIGNGQLSDVTGSAHVMGRYLANAIVSDKSKWRK